MTDATPDRTADPESDRTEPESEFPGRVDAPRGDVTREWELFVRETSDDPLRHAGSVSAPTADIAREQAAKLFGWAAETLWLCPADETRRFTADGVALSDRAAEGPGDVADGSTGPDDGGVDS